MANLDLKPIEKEQTTQEKVYEQIKESILNGKIADDTIFTEVQLAKSLQTSRTPIRAALQDLLNEGLIISVPRKGLTVRKITPEEQDEIFLLRISIETKVIKKVADIISETQLKALREIYNEQEKAMLSEDVIKFIDLDQEFHISLVKIAGYKLIEQILLNLHNLTKLIGLKALSHQGRMKNVLLEHGEIIASLESKDSELAAQRMKQHLMTTNDTLNIIDQPKE
ncbi:GntR family transcriptional regulator [Pueribacillus theae]|uniref:GntR family transcriptional regulator n=1 Tax=Pueribacillus theae TaxID=2171751 RepID=A0A2U1K4U4_9BACI|nr:GntR family transcriptional regulator [Pueribacillus theae]PWA12537.1 GntR family transcriptional regulator [Pueribacillus theae]